jgi:glucan 1,3-beta-glucosidase
MLSYLEVLTNNLNLQQPFSGTQNYPTFRNVKDPRYGAVGDGKTDDWEAIMRAITEGNRCGRGCDATSTRGAIIYFPPGKYLITQAIVQYYFTVFLGHPHDRPTIVGSENFKGIALIDTNVYYDDRSEPNGDGVNW